MPAQHNATAVEQLQNLMRTTALQEVSRTTELRNTVNGAREDFQQWYDAVPHEPDNGQAAIERQDAMQQFEAAAQQYEEGMQDQWRVHDETTNTEALELFRNATRARATAEFIGRADGAPDNVEPHPFHLAGPNLFPAFVDPFEEVDRGELDHPGHRQILVLQIPGNVGM